MAAAFAALRPGSIVVNVARGEIVDAKTVMLLQYAKLNNLVGGA